MSSKLKFGLLLPHFGTHMSVDDCRVGARRAEAYGFDSVWVRDHLIFTPHAGEGGDANHLESLLLLASLAPLTTKLRFGTAMAICHRHPIHSGAVLRRTQRNLQGTADFGPWFRWLSQ